MRSASATATIVKGKAGNVVVAGRNGKSWHVSILWSSAHRIAVAVGVSIGHEQSMALAANRGTEQYGCPPPAMPPAATVSVEAHTRSSSSHG
jgi:hypothetical protein